MPARRTNTTKQIAKQTNIKQINDAQRDLIISDVVVMILIVV
jgi:hypothetical protein